MKPDLEDILKGQGDRTELDLEVGTKLFLGLEGLDQRLVSVYHGADEGSHLIIQTPMVSEVIKRLKPGVRVTVHYMTKGTIRAFQSTVVGFILKPFPLTFVEYPSLVAHQDLRQSPRANCCLPGTIALQEKGFEGLLVNISLGGCRFVLSQNQDPKPPLLKVEQKVGISFSLSEEESRLLAEAEVRNATTLDHLQIMGLRFLSLDRQSRLSIDSYVETVLSLNIPEINGADI